MSEMIDPVGLTEEEYAKAYAKAVVDAMIGGTGFMKIDVRGIHHVPPGEWNLEKVVEEILGEKKEAEGNP